MDDRNQAGPQCCDAKCEPPSRNIAKELQMEREHLENRIQKINRALQFIRERPEAVAFLADVQSRY